MKPRTVAVTLELVTAEALKNLRSARWWHTELGSDPEFRVVQAEANVIRDDE